MGVPGLWGLIRPAAVTTSLLELGREGFLENKNNNRAFTIGVDASIWIFHAQQTYAGSNAFQRTLFHKLCALLQQPIQVVFVFDGPDKPSAKRGQRVAGRFGVNDHHSRLFRELLDLCGMEWWIAPGEAEAELALMNKQGKIDAVLSDDVDALLFGATCLLRNNSPTLSGATQSSASQSNSIHARMRQYDMFRMSDICEEWTKEESALKTEEDCRLAMVLIAILSGGDYAPDGASGLGPTKAMGLAQAGHSTFLKLYTADREAFDKGIGQVQADMAEELRTNSSGFIGKRYKASASRVLELQPEELFPAQPLQWYLSPSTSSKEDASKGWPGFGKGDNSACRGKARNNGLIDLEGMARTCEVLFEWGTRDLVCKKFATASVNLFGADIVAEARRRVMAASPGVSVTQVTVEGSRSSGGPAGRLTSYFSQSVTRTTIRRPSIPEHFIKLHSSRVSRTCEGITEYRLAFNPEPYIQRVRQAMEGTRLDPSALTPEEREELGLIEANKATDTSVNDEIRIWLPEYLIRHAFPALLTRYEAELEAKAIAKSTPKKKKAVSKKAGTSAGNPAVFRNFFLRPPAAPLSTNGESSYKDPANPTSTCRALPSSTPRNTVRRRSSDLSSAPSSPSKSLGGVASSPDKEKRSHSVLSTSSHASDSSDCLPSSHPSPTKKHTARRITRKAGERLRTPNRAASADSTGSAVEPIDLTVSSDDDTPKQLLASQLPASMATPNRPPSPTPTPRTSSTARTSVVASVLAAEATPEPLGSLNPHSPASEALDHASSSPRSPTFESPGSPPAVLETTAPSNQSSAGPNPQADAMIPHGSLPASPVTSPTVTVTQSLLTSMIVARPRPKAVPKALPIRKPRYVVFEDDDGVEHIDFTQ